MDTTTSVWKYKYYHTRMESVLVSVPIGTIGTDIGSLDNRYR